MRVREAALTMAQQQYALKYSRVFNGAGSIRKGELVWDFAAQPTLVSRTYSARLRYRMGKLPGVYVLEPDLVDLAGGQSLPHVYEQKPPRLCLFLPGTGEWRPSMLIERTFLPWTVLWLFYFEAWLGSGEWEGGGVHPPAPGGKRETHTRN